MSDKDGGLAFPAIAVDGYVHNVGMTLRDYFAAHAVTGFISAGLMGSAISEVARKNPGATDKQFEQEAAQMLATGSYLIADALLKERAK